MLNHCLVIVFNLLTLAHSYHCYLLTRAHSYFCLLINYLIWISRERINYVDVAIKVIAKSAKKTNDDVLFKRRIENEIKVHSKLKHNNIVELYTVFEDDDAVYVVMELCAQGNLYKYLKLYGTLNEKEAAFIMHQLLLALEYMHTIGIVHRDLKLSNILISDIGDGEANELNVKLCDFGLAVILEHPDEEHFTLCGTPNYIAPEVAMQRSHGLPADLWSVGCLFYSMVVGAPPFEQGDVKHTLQKIVTGEYSEPSGISENALDFMRSLLDINPLKRASVTEILSHPFIATAINDDTLPIIGNISTITCTETDRTSGQSYSQSSSLSMPLSISVDHYPLYAPSANSNEYHNQLWQERHIPEKYGRFSPPSESRTKNASKASILVSSMNSRDYSKPQPSFEPDTSLKGVNIHRSLKQGSTDKGNRYDRNNSGDSSTSSSSISVSKSLARMSSGWINNIHGVRESSNMCTDTSNQVVVTPTPILPNIITSMQPFKYVDSKGDMILISNEHDILISTKLKISGKLMPSRLIVRSSNPLELKFGSVDTIMLSELEKLYAHKDVTVNGNADSTLTSAKLDLLKDKLMLKSYSIYKLPSIIQKIYLKASKMLEIINAKLPKVIVYLTPTTTVSSSDTKASSDCYSIPCKCMLMSNEPLPDYRVQWANGTTLKYSLQSGSLKIELCNAYASSNTSNDSSTTATDDLFVWEGFMHNDYNSSVSVNDSNDIGKLRDSAETDSDKLSSNHINFNSSNFPDRIKSYIHIAQLTMGKCIQMAAKSNSSTSYPIITVEKIDFEG